MMWYKMPATNRTKKAYKSDSQVLKGNPRKNSSGFELKDYYTPDDVKGSYKSKLGAPDKGPRKKERGNTLLSFEGDTSGLHWSSPDC